MHLKLPLPATSVDAAIALLANACAGMTCSLVAVLSNFWTSIGEPRHPFNGTSSTASSLSPADKAPQRSAVLAVHNMAFETTSIVCTLEIFRRKKKRHRRKYWVYPIYCDRLLKGKFYVVSYL
nr:unnamed protein product [Callosobruchus analis]